MSNVSALPTGSIKEFLPSGQAGNIFRIVLIGGIVILILYFAYKTFKGFGGAVDGVLETLHLKDDPATAAAKDAVNGAINTATSGSANAWSPTFHNTAPEGTVLPSSEGAKAICNQIWDSVGAFYDSPEDGLAAIKECVNKVGVSWVVDMFNRLYQKDLLAWLQQKYDRRDQVAVLSQIVTYVNNLPNYSTQ